MRFIIFLLMIFLVGCQSEADTKASLEMLSKLKPLSAEEQAKEIKFCEENSGWTGQAVTYSNITVQIRCVRK